MREQVFPKRRRPWELSLLIFGFCACVALTGCQGKVHRANGNAYAQSDVCNSGLWKVPKYQHFYDKIRSCIDRKVGLGQTCQKAVSKCEWVESSYVAQAAEKAKRVREEREREAARAREARERHTHLMKTDRTYRRAYKRRMKRQERARKREARKRRARAKAQRKSDWANWASVKAACSRICTEQGHDGYGQAGMAKHVACVNRCLRLANQ